LANTLALNEGVGLWKTETEDDDQDWRSSTKPEKRPPSVRSGVDKAASEDGREQISECVSLLEHTRHDTSCSFWTVFESGRRRVAVQPAHRDTVDSTDSKELLVGLAETSAKFEDDEKYIVDHKRPFATVTVGSDTEENSADGSEHEDQCNTPCDVGLANIERFGEISNGEGDGEKVEGIPGPGDESAEKEEPLHTAEHGKELEWIRKPLVAWLQGTNSGCHVATGAHIVLGGVGVVGSLLLQLMG